MTNQTATPNSPWYHIPAGLITTILDAMEANPDGGTINIHTRLAPDNGHYAVGGYAQAWDSFGALFYTISDNPLDLVRDNEFWQDLASRIQQHWHEIYRVGHIGWWATNGEFFVDAVEILPCKHNSGSSVFETQHVRSIAMANGTDNQQDAIGHVCTDGNYEEIEL